MMEADKVINSIRDKINKRKADVLVGLAGDDRTLLGAMQYSFTDHNSKNTRSILFSLLSLFFGVAEECYLDIGVALELIHCYSLIHDDLPALDNDDYRRGKNSLHKEFSESTAILVGDGLLIMAFEVLSSLKGVDAFNIVHIIKMVTSYIGVRGMILGQFADLNTSTNTSITKAFIETVHENKSACVFAVGCEIVAVLCSLDDADTSVIRSIGVSFGMMVQLADDIIDVSKEENINMVQKIGINATKELLNQRATSLQKGIETLQLKYRSKDDRDRYLDYLVYLARMAGVLVS